MPRPHLLYLAWGFPPSHSSGVHRALATTNAFARAGWDVTVVTVERETFERYTGTDPSLEAHVADGVDVVRIPFPWPAQETDVRRYSALRVLLPPVWARLRRWADQVPFPEASYGPWLRPLATAARGVHARHPVDLTVATGNPHMTFAAAHELHRADGVPYVMDYRDAWRLNTFTGATVRPRWGRTGRWERRLLAGAREAWFVNEPIRAWHAREYPDLADRMHVVENGWDPEILQVTPPVAPEPGAPLRFGYLGTITPQVPLVALLDGWRAAVEQGLVPTGSTLEMAGHLGHFAVPQGDVADLLAAARPTGVRFVGPVPKAEVGAWYSRTDVLVLAMGAGEYVTGGKAYEYVAAGRPVVAVHDPRNATTAVLADHPLVAAVRRVDATEVTRVLGEAAGLAGRVEGPDGARVQELARHLRREERLAPRIAALTPGGAS